MYGCCTLCRRCFVIELENQMIMRVNGTEGYATRALTGHYQWRAIGNSLNQNWSPFGQTQFTLLFG